jgi:hypothetical protein
MFQDTYNELMCTTTVIRFSNKPSEHATGFFYNYGNDTFLITNRHVLEHEKNQPQEISIWFRDYSDINKTNRCDIPLYEDQFPRWLIHPFFREVDIAVLPLNQKLSHVNDEEYKTGSLALSAETFANSELLIRGGTGARVFGYPEGYIDSSSHFPVARDGLIASPYGNWFEEHPQFLVDGKMGDGMSGSPVFTDRTTHFEKIEGDPHIAGATAFFIGVHSGAYRTAEGAQSSELDINNVWYSELIEIILNINGLCEFVSGVEFSTASEIINHNIDSAFLSEIVSEVGTWDLFDPEQNKVESPSQKLEEEIRPETLLQIVSLLEESSERKEG